jgi:hypothetical protein
VSPLPYGHSTPTVRYGCFRTALVVSLYPSIPYIRVRVPVGSRPGSKFRVLELFLDASKHRPIDFSVSY